MITRKKTGRKLHHRGKLMQLVLWAKFVFCSGSVQAVDETVGAWLPGASEAYVTGEETWQRSKVYISAWQEDHSPGAAIHHHRRERQLMGRSVSASGKGKPGSLSIRQNEYDPENFRCASSLNQEEMKWKITYKRELKYVIIFDYYPGRNFLRQL